MTRDDAQSSPCDSSLGLRVEGYDEKYESEIQALLGQRTGALEHWRWMRRASPWGAPESHVVLAFKEDKLVELLAAAPSRILHRGSASLGAEICAGLGLGSSLGPRERVALLHHLLASLEDAGVGFVYAAEGGVLSAEFLEEGGLEPAYDLVGRHLPVSMGPRDKDEGPSTVQRVAKLARRLRQKLIEVEPDDMWLGFAQRLFFQRAPDLDFALDRNAAHFRWRYREHPVRRYRFSVLRRKAGTGLDAFVIWRIVEVAGGRRALQLVDHWTKVGERRSTAWLLGEMALLGVAEEGVDVIEAHAPAGSALEQAMVASGCILKRGHEPIYVRPLGAEREHGAWTLGQAVQLRAGDFERF